MTISAMKIRSIITLLLLLYCFAATAQRCGSCNTRTSHYRFKLLKRYGLKVDTNLVKTNGVFLGKYTTSLQTEYFFIRFFSNGRYYSSCHYASLPTDSAVLNDLRWGYYGYYKIDSNMLTVESHTSAGGYYYAYYTIGDNELISKYTNSRAKGSGNILQPTPNISCKFYPCQLRSQSFW